MGNPFKALPRKSDNSVTPSGVSFEYYSLRGQNESDLTSSKEEKRKKALHAVLKDCIKSIGSKTTIIDADIDNLLQQDRKFILWQIRMLSNDNNPKFTFEYEFPTTSERRARTYNIIFDRQSFPFLPYRWVKKQILADYQKENELKDDWTPDEDAERQIYLNTQEFPVVYAEYADMISAERLREVTIEDIRFQYKLVDGAMEKEFIKLVGKGEQSSHSYFQIRDARYIDSEDDSVNLIPYNDVPSNTLDKLRSEMLSVDARIHTSQVVEYPSSGQKENVDLVETAAFFFPSLGK